MSEILFYHLQNRRLEDVLPVLLSRTLGRGLKAVVRASSPERVKALDDHLWSYDEASFLPHGTEADGDPASQPILLTTADQRPNGAEVLFLVDGATIPPEPFPARLVIIFDGEDAGQLQSARAGWRQLVASGHQATYWQQNERGGWEKKA